MAAGQPWPPPLMSSSVRTERLLRAACAAMAAAGALLLGFSAQTKTVLFVQKKAVPKDVQALWVLTVAAAAAAAYHAAQLAQCLCMDRLASRTGGGGAGCRRLGRAIACATFLLDKGCAYMVFATAAAALQACFVGLLGVEALQWSKLCNIYTRFCVQGGAGVVCSLLAAAGMAVLSAFSARDVFRHRRPCSPCTARQLQCVQVQQL